MDVVTVTVTAPGEASETETDVMSGAALSSPAESEYGPAADSATLVPTRADAASAPAASSLNVRL